MTLRRNRQLAIGPQVADGTAKTLAAADVIECYELTFAHDIGRNERKPHSSTLAMRKSLTGLQKGGLNFGLELRGTGTATDVPECLQVLQYCGHRLVNTHSIAIGAVTSGPFTHGEVVTGGTSSGTARVIGDTANGAAVLYLEPISGTLQSGEVLTGGTSGATATSSGAPAHAGVGARPWSPKNVEYVTIGAVTSGPFLVGERVEGGTSGAFGRLMRAAANGVAGLYIETLSGTFQNSETITGEDSGASATASAGPASQYFYGGVATAALRDGQKVHGIFDARGNVSLAANNGDRVMLNVELRGRYVTVADGSFFSGTSLNQTFPPSFQGNGLAIGGYTPQFSSFGLSVGGNIVVRESAAESDGLTSAIITDRDVELTLDPASVAEASHPFFADWVGDVERMVDLLVTRAAGNRFRMIFPQVQHKAISDDDREGEAVSGLTCQCNDSTDNDQDYFIMSY